MRVKERFFTPKNGDYIKKIIMKNGETAYSFFHYRYKVENDKYEVIERYVVYVTNIIPTPNTEVIVTKIMGTQPKMLIDRRGRKHLNCVVWCELDFVTDSTDTETNIDYDLPLPF